MSGKLEVSFNSPQCGWMSIGFEDETSEFHTTTAHAPYSGVLSELLETLVKLLGDDDFNHSLKWNRDPEEFDFIFKREGENVLFEIIEYPTSERDLSKSEKVYFYVGDAKQFAEAFYITFAQLFAERNIDEFEDNWHQKFPLEEFEKLRDSLNI
jgi:hypothetical protein